MKKLISLITTALVLIGIVSATSYAEESAENPTYTYNTAEELLDALISEDEEFSDGGLIYTNKYKIDIFMHSPDSFNLATIIIYGFEDSKQLRNDRPAINTKDYLGTAPATELHSGYCFYIFGGITEKAKLGEKQGISIYYFANNSVRDSSQRELGLIEGSRYYGFDVAPYIYPEIIAGDTDGDGMITAIDASTVLSAYSMLSTDKELILNSTIFDYNNDGIVNAVDASAILNRYSEISTTTN